jgi:hypothetical protein
MILFQHVNNSFLTEYGGVWLLLDFRHKFGVIHQSYTPNKEREFYSTPSTTVLVVNNSNIHWPVHLTAVTDTRRTTVIISSGTLRPCSCNTSTLIYFDFSARYDHQRKLAKYETGLIKKSLLKLLDCLESQAASFFWPCIHQLIPHFHTTNTFMNSCC